MSSRVRHAHTNDISVSELSHLLSAAGFPLPLPLVHSLHTYLTLLLRWNQTINLTASPSLAHLARTHIPDSLVLADLLTHIPFPDTSLCLDLGAGAGLPGIPLRLLWTHGSYVLVERRQKRASFLRTAVARLGLVRTSVAEGSLEDLYPGDCHNCDCVVSKAFLPINKLLPIAHALLRPNGILAILTTEAYPQTTREHTQGHWTLVRETQYRIPDKSRWIWLLSPTVDTPTQHGSRPQERHACTTPKTVFSGNKGFT